MMGCFLIIIIIDLRVAEYYKTFSLSVKALEEPVIETVFMETQITRALVIKEQITSCCSLKNNYIFIKY